MRIFRYLIALLTIAVLVPAGAMAAPAAFTTLDESEFGPLFYDASGTNLQDHSVTIAPGRPSASITRSAWGRTTSGSSPSVCSRVPARRPQAR